MPLDDETKNKIQEVYKNNNYPGAKALIKLVKEAHPEISSRSVNEFLSKDVGTQLTKVQQKKQPEGHITSTLPNEFWQFDIFDLSRYESQNDGYKYIFGCVDVFTRKAYMEPMKQKNSEACAAALKEILKRSGVKPRSMLSDQDGAFLQGPFEKYTTKEGIMMNTNALKDHRALGVIDNYARRLKAGLTKIFLRQKNTKWTDILQKFVDVENGKKTTALNDVAPNDATKPENKEAILDQNLEKNMHNNTVTDLKPGDLVRKSTQKSDTAKGTDPRWSDELYRVKGTNGMTIILTDDTKLKRTDLLKVPEGTQYEGKNPIRAQKEENRKVKDKENREKEEAYKEKKSKDQPVIHVIPLGGGGSSSSSSAAPAPAPKKAGRPPSGKPPNPKFQGLRSTYGTVTQLK